MQKLPPRLSVLRLRLFNRKCNIYNLVYTPRKLCEGPLGSPPNSDRSKEGVHQSLSPHTSSALPRGLRPIIQTYSSYQSFVFSMNNLKTQMFIISMIITPKVLYVHHQIEFVYKSEK